ncbi:hypothetical protein HG536_0A09560 [Torulaspora globosa]|uniref:Initiator tRNA phosphoribosyl transferase n=1 Tax=Torulaspora globosa TaxID=48254 RepID=A0A7G3ZCA3_9SACH|nr:uncharacterized protein HG536_0A09560 [Torulaspora globosa]QLL31139.1 hypothetical protein HG536_0A09560 [Torulaspora globosa]
MDQDIRAVRNQIQKAIKKDDRSLRNRLQSILLDNSFLCHMVLPRFPNFPVIPNERCGLWYCDPKQYGQTSYFKSTDGHVNQWDFSVRRLNFHLLPTIAKNSGVIIVDSTRRGKKIPDALSKTVPIWCAVLNSIAMEHRNGSSEQEILYLPPTSVSESERHSIRTRLPALVKKLKEFDIIDGRKLHEQLGGRLLRPFWVYPGSPMLEPITDVFTGEVLQKIWDFGDDNIIPIILCTVSYCAQDGIDKRYGFTYVQGAADDHELWSQGLTAQLFWSDIDYLRDSNRSEQEIESRVAELVFKNDCASKDITVDYAFPQIDSVTPELSLGRVRDNLEITENLIVQLGESYSVIIILSSSVKISAPKPLKDEFTELIKVYKLQSGSKASSKELRNQLLRIAPPLQAKVLEKPRKPILISCNSGTDVSVGLLLAILSLDYGPDWTLGSPTVINKTTVKKHLAKIISHLQGRNVNPSRATLNSVNHYLLWSNSLVNTSN